MSEQQGPMPYWSIAAYLAGGVISIGVVTQGAVTSSFDLVAIGALALVVVIATAPISFLLHAGAGRAKPSNALRREISDLSAQIASLNEMQALDPEPFQRPVDDRFNIARSQGRQLLQVRDQLRVDLDPVGNL